MITHSQVSGNYNLNSVLSLSSKLFSVQYQQIAATVPEINKCGPYLWHRGNRLWHSLLLLSRSDLFRCVVIFQPCNISDRGGTLIVLQSQPGKRQWNGTNVGSLRYSSIVLDLSLPNHVFTARQQQ